MRMGWGCAGLRQPTLRQSQRLLTSSPTNKNVKELRADILVHRVWILAGERKKPLVRHYPYFSFTIFGIRSMQKRVDGQIAQIKEY
jgi:hypothetical protein